MRAGRFQPSRHWVLSRNAAKGWTRAARCLLVLLACLAQLLVPAQHRHAQPTVSHSTVFTTAATGSGLALANFDEGKSAVRCTLAGGDLDSHNDGTPPPCQQDDCPCCPTVHAAAVILPPETTQAAFSPRLLKAIAPPALLGTLRRFAAFAGQPRAPPILI